MRFQVKIKHPDWGKFWWDEDGDFTEIAYHFSIPQRNYTPWYITKISVIRKFFSKTISAKKFSRQQDHKDHILSLFPGGIILPDTQWGYLSSGHSSARLYLSRNLSSSRITRTTYCLCVFPSGAWTRQGWQIHWNHLLFQISSRNIFPNGIFSCLRGFKDHILSLKFPQWSFNKSKGGNFIEMADHPKSTRKFFREDKSTKKYLPTHGIIRTAFCLHEFLSRTITFMVTHCRKLLANCHQRTRIIQIPQRNPYSGLAKLRFRELLVPNGVYPFSFSK